MAAPPPPVLQEMAHPLPAGQESTVPLQEAAAVAPATAMQLGQCTSMCNKGQQAGHALVPAQEQRSRGADLQPPPQQQQWEQVQWTSWQQGCGKSCSSETGMIVNVKVIDWEEGEAEKGGLPLLSPLSSLPSGDGG